MGQQTRKTPAEQANSGMKSSAPTAPAAMLRQAGGSGSGIRIGQGWRNPVRWSLCALLLLLALGVPLAHATDVYRWLWPEELSATQEAMIERAKPRIALAIKDGQLRAARNNTFPSEYSPSSSPVAIRRVRDAAKRLGIPVGKAWPVAGLQGRGGLADPATGRIFVEERLAEKASDVLLAFVLAHEWGHIALEHAHWSFVTYFAHKAYACGACAEVGHPVLVAGAMGRSDALENTRSVLKMSQEFEADAYAFFLIRARGFEAEPAVVFNEMLSVLGPVAAGYNFETDSHPSWINRLINVEGIDAGWPGLLPVRLPPYALPPLSTLR